MQGTNLCNKIIRYNKLTDKKMANQMETGHRSQHDKSEGASTRQQ